MLQQSNEEKSNHNYEEGNMAEESTLYEESWNKSILKLDNEEVNYWFYKLIDEIKKKIKYYESIFEGIEKLYSNEFFEGVPSLTELIHRCEAYRRKNGDDFKETLGQKVTMFKSYMDKKA